jgi:hypothetical protein
VIWLGVAFGIVSLHMAGLSRDKLGPNPFSFSIMPDDECVQAWANAGSALCRRVRRLTRAGTRDAPVRTRPPGSRHMRIKTEHSSRAASAPTHAGTPYGARLGTCFREGFLLAALALTPIWVGFLGWSLYGVALALFHYFE